jgi:hypothetical protein
MAIAFPIPLPAPVTIATLSVKEKPDKLILAASFGEKHTYIIIGGLLIKP